jgi:hypothetical protein
MEPIDDPKAWAGGLLLLLISIIGFGSKRHMNQTDARLKALDDAHEKLTDRTTALESHFATRADLEALYLRVNALSEQSHNQFNVLTQRISDQSTHMNTQHTAILTAVSNLKA